VTALAGAGALGAGLFLALAATAAWVRRAQGGGGRAPVLLTAATLVAALSACLALEYALVTHDFSVRYVAEQGGLDIPLYYRVTALWAGLEGSLLLWLLVLTGIATAVATRPPGRVTGALHAWASAVLAALGAVFFAVAILGGNAFDRISPAPADGPGPNPLLQDAPLMGVHPPVLYLGYVGLAVPFAYAMAALVTGRTGREWVRAVRRWTLLAWAALTGGIVLGAWWSYAVLGWGGYWAWDPVENASLLPWLTTTALLHSLVVQERRATLRVWNLALACASFLLVLVGTFLTRSGVVDSVHAFTVSSIGPLLLTVILVALAVVVGLFTWRAGTLGPVRRLGAPLSRETAFVANNVVLVGLAAVILLGTLLPAVVEATTRQQVSVGAPYFDRFTVPAVLVLLVLMVVGPLVRWGADDAGSLAGRLTVPLVAGAAAALVAVVVGARGLVILTVALAAAVAATGAARLGTAAARLRAVAGLPWPRALARAARCRRRLHGGLLAHTGLALAAVAVAVSTAHTQVGEQRLEPGEAVSVGAWSAQLDGVTRTADGRRMAVDAVLTLRHGTAAGAGEDRGQVYPRLAFWTDHDLVVGTPAVRSGVAGDVYATVTSAADDGSWAHVRLSVNPFMPWLWISGAVMVAGAAIAAWPAGRRRRDRTGSAVAARAGVP
jgi:cytochrome c-type biogenesis protein CcmF